MNKKPFTRVVILLDKSGSMKSIQGKAVEWFNEQVQKFRDIAKEQELTISLITFNHNVDEHLWNMPVSELSEAKAEDYFADGGTSMQDALYYGITKMRESADTDDKETAYLFICISDGDSRDDKVCNLEMLNGVIEECEASKRWTFTFVGCERSKLQKLSKALGVSASNFAAWDSSTPIAAACGLRNANRRTYGYFEGRAKGMTASNTYMNDTLDMVADFTDDADTPQTGVVHAIPDHKQTEQNLAAIKQAIIDQGEKKPAPKRPKITYAVTDPKVTGTSVFGTRRTVKWNQP